MEISEKALPHHILMFRVAVVSEGLDGDAATRVEQPYDFQILGLHQLDEVFHYDIDTVLVKIAMITEAEEVEFKALALHHQRTGDVINNKVSEIGLTRLGTQRSELGAIKRHQIVILGVFVLEGLQHFGGIVIAVLRILVAQQGNAFQLLFVSRHRLQFCRKISKMFAISTEKRHTFVALNNQPHEKTFFIIPDRQHSMLLSLSFL